MLRWITHTSASANISWKNSNCTQRHEWIWLLKFIISWIVYLFSFKGHRYKCKAFSFIYLSLEIITVSFTFFSTEMERGEKLLPGFLRFHDARRPKMSKYSHRCCFPAWGIMGSRVIRTSTPVIRTTTSVSVWKMQKVFMANSERLIEINQVILFCYFVIKKNKNKYLILNRLHVRQLTIWALPLHPGNSHDCVPKLQRRLF